MMMNSLAGVSAWLFIFTFLVPGIVLAQEQDDGIGMEGHMRNGSLVFETAFVDGPRSGDPVIVGQPYSAVQVSEHSETLADGTKIHSKWESARLYRDAQGRTRAERFTWAGALPVHTVEPGRRIARISDPVTGYVYVLDLRRHIAHRLKILTGEEFAERIRNEENVEATADAQQAAPDPRLGASSPGPEVKQRKLAKNLFEGGELAVRQMTITTPKGLEGNDRPLVLACENQYSEELKSTILSKCSGPRAGDNITRLEILERTDPDPALFQVPTDYTVVDEVDQFRIDLVIADAPKER
jgi:hypothetical protein